MALRRRGLWGGFASGLGAMSAVYTVGATVRRNDPVLTLVLAGVAIGALLGSAISLLEVPPSALTVRGLDCLDGTPLLDLKPDRSLFTAIAPPQPGDFA